jgi:radical SAM protein with 4Fe4S-binding SPASM domain
LSGGEPTLRDDLPQLIERISATHQCDALLMTNGLRWSRDYARRLQACGLKFVQVSVEGPEPLNDEVRGPGTYRAAMRTIDMLLECGLRVTLSLTVTRRNCVSLRDFVGLHDHSEVHFHLREVIPIGGGARCSELSPAQRKALYSWAIGYRGKSSIGMEDPIHCSIDPNYAARCTGCVAAVSHFCVDVDGSVCPCRPLRIPVGHVDDLTSAWCSPTMDRIRCRKFDGNCGRCRLRDSCGGCRVHAMLNGSPFGSDPRCFALEKGLLLHPFEQRAVDLAARTGAMIGQLVSLARLKH